MYSIRDGITFDDVLLVPQHSKVVSRSDVDVSVTVKGTKYLHPIIPANMQTITGHEMAQAVSRSGGLALVHRFMPFEDQLAIAKAEQDRTNSIGFSVGVKAEYKDNIMQLSDYGVKIFCIDIAHGDSDGGVAMTYWIRDNYPDAVIISGNVATYSGAYNLWRAGADIVKVGVGPGSLCTTRIETGNGVPQLTALINVAEAKSMLPNPDKAFIIADGGIKNAGDIVKALCFADMIMAGNIFAGCVETPGNILSIMGKTYKEYKGSSTHKTNHVEGVTTIVPTKGRFIDILNKLLEGLKSGCSYQGAHNLIELKDHPEFVKITNSGLIESHPHNIGKP
jgi:IMP dehydrogenase